MKNTIIIVLLSAILFVNVWHSIQPTTKTDYRVLFIQNDTVYVEKTAPIPKDTVIVNRALVCRVDPFGFLGEGSNFFNPAIAEKGYDIVVKRDGNIIGHTLTNKAELTKNLELVKYKMNIK